MSMNFDCDSKLLATGSRNGAINIFNLNYGEIETKIDCIDESDESPFDTEVRYPVTCLKWKPKFGGIRNQNNILAASYGNNMIKIWDNTSPKEARHTISEEDNKGVYSIDYNNSGTMLVSGGADATLRIYDGNEMKVIQKYAPGLSGKVHHFNRIHWVKFHPEDERLIYSGGADRQVWIHDIRVKDPIDFIYGPYIIGESIDILGSKLLTGSYRSKDWLEIWDIRTNEKLTTIDWESENPQNGGQIIAAKFTKESPARVAASSRAQKEVKIFDLVNEDFLVKIDGFKTTNYSMDINYEGNLISIGNQDGSVYLYEYE